MSETPIGGLSIPEVQAAVHTFEKEAELQRIQERLSIVSKDILDARGELGSIAMRIAMLCKDRVSAAEIREIGVTAFNACSSREIADIQEVLTFRMQELKRQGSM